MIPDFAPNTLFFSLLFRSGSWILWSFCVVLSIICPNCPQVYLFFSPLSFLCILLLKETFVQVQACSNWSRSQPGTKVVWHLERCKRLYPWCFGWRKNHCTCFCFICVVANWSSFIDFNLELRIKHPLMRNTAWSRVFMLFYFLKWLCFRCNFLCNLSSRNFTCDSLQWLVCDYDYEVHSIRI